MKKLVLLLSTILIITSCDSIIASFVPDTTVINNSSYLVAFKFSQGDKDIKTLNSGDTASSKYNVSSILILQPEKRVAQKSDGGRGSIIISDLPSWEVYVENKTENPITLTANGWMDNIVNIPVGNFVDDIAHKGRVYIKNPAFAVASSTFPLDVQWQFVDDIFYVIIQ